MKKKNLMEWEPEAWLRDQGVRVLSLASRGFWVDILNYMDCNGRTGRMTASIPQLSRLIGCTEQEVHNCLNDIKTSGTADVNDQEGMVTITNRRMLREHAERELAQARVRKHRAEQEAAGAFDVPCNANETQEFDQFWAAYPRKVKKEQARESYVKACRMTGFPGIQQLLASIEQQKRSPDWSRDEGRYIPYPSTWLNQKRWTDFSDGSVFQAHNPFKKTRNGNL